MFDSLKKEILKNAIETALDQNETPRDGVKEVLYALVEVLQEKAQFVSEAHSDIRLMRVYEGFANRIEKGTRNL